MESRHRRISSGKYDAIAGGGEGAENIASFRGTRVTRCAQYVNTGRKKEKERKMQGTYALQTSLRRIASFVVPRLHLSQFEGALRIYGLFSRAAPRLSLEGRGGGERGRGILHLNRRTGR